MACRSTAPDELPLVVTFSPSGLIIKLRESGGPFVLTAKALAASGAFAFLGCRDMKLRSLPGTDFNQIATFFALFC